MTVLQKPLLYFQTICVKLKQYQLVLVRIRPARSQFGEDWCKVPPAQSWCGRVTLPPALEEVFQRGDQNNNLKNKTKECTQIIELSKGVCLGFFPFPFTCVHMCVYIFCKVELQKKNMVRGAL